MSRKRTWLCDPHKNDCCKKTNCYYNGGPCSHTMHREFMLDMNSWKRMPELIKALGKR